MTGIELIAAERQRQIEVEGWTSEHDDQHICGILAKQAASLAVNHTDAVVTEDVANLDPWGLTHKHRRDVLRSLAISGALIAAEMDRIQRMK